MQDVRGASSMATASPGFLPIKGYLSLRAGRGPRHGLGDCGGVCRVAGKISRKKEQLAKLELSQKVKEDLKTVALGTSKINYLDPRITVAWCKRLEVRSCMSLHATAAGPAVWCMLVLCDACRWMKFCMLLLCLATHGTKQVARFSQSWLPQPRSCGPQG